MGIVLLGFNPICALVGIVSYLAFIVYSLRGEAVDESPMKDEEKDLELGWCFPVCFMCECVGVGVDDLCCSLLNSLLNS
jgi:hypothetical protein